MKRTFALAALLAASMAMPAMASEQRMSDATYMSAARCLAFTDLPQLSDAGFDATSLREAVDTQRGGRVQAVRNQVRTDTREIERLGARSDSERELAALRQRMDDACSSFVHRGMVSVGANPAS